MIITRRYVLQGPNQGRTVTLGGSFRFVNGVYELTADLATQDAVARFLVRNWQAVPEAAGARAEPETLQGILDGRDELERRIIQAERNLAEMLGVESCSLEVGLGLVRDLHRRLGIRGSIQEIIHADSIPAQPADSADGPELHDLARAVEAAPGAAARGEGDDLGADAAGAEEDASAGAHGPRDPVIPAPGSKAERIMAAVGALDHANDEHWTAEGHPRVAAVKELLGEPVTSAEIQAAAPGAARVHAL